MTQHEQWMKHYNDYMAFIKTYNKRPSKHHLEDHELFNWFKHNKKIYTSGSMPFERLIVFRHLLDVAEEYRMINQYAYVHEETQKAHGPLPQARDGQEGNLPFE